MKKYIIAGLLVFSVLVPVASFAQTLPSDVDPNPDTSGCVIITNNLRYRSRDANTNGEVSMLQDFLQAKNYLNSEPTGYFGLLTLKAVKDFQNANGINPTGFVGPVTRAKIKAVSCGTETDSVTMFPPGCTSNIGFSPTTGQPCNGSGGGGGSNFPPGCTSNIGFSPKTGNPCDGTIRIDLVIDGVSGPQTLNVNQQGTWTVKAHSNDGGNLSYGVNWGDEVNINAPYQFSAQREQQSATFMHSYSEARTYNPTFTVTNNSGQSAQTSLSVNVGNVIGTNSVHILTPNGGETCHIGSVCSIFFTYDNKISTTNNYFALYLMKDGKEIYNPLTVPLSTVTYGYYNWLIPAGTNNSDINNGGSNFKIRAKIYNYATGQLIASDESDAPFTITNGTTTPSLTITTTSPLPNGKVGWPYYAKIETSKIDTGSSGYTHTITAGSMPAGLTLGGPCSSSVCAGIIGAPTSAGKYTFTVTFNMSDGTGKASKEFIMNVDSSNTAPPNLVITNNSPLPNAKVGSSYQLPLGVQGGLSGISLNSYNWSVKSGSLPDGLYFSGSDQGIMLAGTPTIAGTYNFTLSTYFSSPVQSGSKNFTLTVDPATTPTTSLTITTTSPLPNAKSGQPYSATLNTSGIDPSNGYNWSAGDGFPLNGLSFGPSYGSSIRITGTPSNGGRIVPDIFTFNVTVNSGSQTVTKQFSLTVDPADAKGVCDYANPPKDYHYEGGQPYPVCGAHLVADTVVVTVVPISQITTGEKFIKNLYKTFYGREPASNDSGLQFWLNSFNNGQPVTELYRAFLRASEFAEKNPGISNRDFTKLMYQTTLYRNADDSGLNFWTNELDTNRKNKEDLLNAFLVSGEFVDNILPKLNALRTGTVLGAESFNFTLWLAKGSSGNEVMELQKFLNKAGYDAGIADGSFGLKTEASVIKFQLANGLAPDGIVGALTRILLNK